MLRLFFLIAFIVFGSARGLAQDSNGILVKFKSPNLSLRQIQTSVSPAVRSCEKLISRAGLKNSPPLAGWYWLQLDQEQALATTLEKLWKLPEVEMAEPNRLYQVAATPDDPYFFQQWALQPEGINWIPVPERKSVTTPIVVGLLDTGIDIYHPDLAPNIWRNPAEIPNNEIDDDGNGYVDDMFGWDFSENDNQPLPEEMQNEFGDFGWHGTHCAGILGAVSNNQEGISGAFPDGQIMCLKIFPEAYFSTIVRAIHYAVENGAQILSNSWGGSFGSQVVHETLRWATQQGVLCLFAAGNGSRDGYFFPAVYPEVIAVSAGDRNGQRAWFSNFGDWVDFSSPGVDILSTGPTNYGDYPAYFYHSGTSMAVPFVAGVAAQLKMQHPDWSNDLILQQLRRTAEYRGSTIPGAGCIDARLALTCPPETSLTVFEETWPDGQRYQIFYQRLKAFAGVPPYQWQLENLADLPAGLDFSRLGEIYGVPRDTCDGRLEFSVVDASGKKINFSRQLKIIAPPLLTNVAPGAATAPVKSERIRNYPNPFSPGRESTTITFSLPDEGMTQLAIFNIIGECVRHLTSRRFSAGIHSVVWDGKDDDGSLVSQGFYFCRVVCRNIPTSHRILVVN